MTYVIGLIALGILVLIHESGHFLMARLCGVKVEAFSIGMGPVLLHKTIHGVDYRLSLIPFGGYCAMKGENDFKEALENKSKIIDGDEDSFYGIHPLKRLLIAFAGPFSNLLLGFLAFFIVALMGYTYYSAGTTVFMADEKIENSTSSAHKAGLLSGDEIISINGTAMESFADIASYISVRPDETVEISVKRNNETLSFQVPVELNKDTGTGRIGIVADKDSVKEMHYPSHSFPGAVKEGCVKTGQFLYLTVKSIFILFKGVNVSKAVSGPVKITQVMGDTVKSGYGEGFHTGTVATLELLALISLSLFFTNMLPLPVLDGGLILFALIEWISGKKMNPRIQLYIQYAGVAILAFLMIFALICDFSFLLSK